MDKERVKMLCYVGLPYESGTKELTKISGEYSVAPSKWLIEQWYPKTIPPNIMKS